MEKEELLHVEEAFVMEEEQLLHSELGAGSLLVVEPHGSCDDLVETDFDG